MTQLVIATPVDGDAVTGQVSAGYAIPLAKLLRDNHGLDVIPAQVTYSTDIVRARNRVAAMVLREMPNASHVLWWDSDVHPHDLGIVGRMIATGQDVIGAPYLRKRPEPAWTHREFPPQNGTLESDQWMPVKSVGFGFTLTTTEALREVSNFSRPYVDKRTDGTKHEVRGIFDLAYVTDEDGDTVQESEDYSFCHRWRDLGGTVALYLGPGNLLSHVGHHAYRLGNV